MWKEEPIIATRERWKALMPPLSTRMCDYKEIQEFKLTYQVSVLKNFGAYQSFLLQCPEEFGKEFQQAIEAKGSIEIALAQCAIALGILYRPTVKLALAFSFLWTIYVWWFGEAFGMLFMGMAMPLTGAPGAVLLYGLIGLIVWPNGRPGGLVGVRGARTIWAAVWLVMTYLWLLAASSSANAIHNAINAAPSGMSWLSSVQDAFASITKGNGLLIAVVLAAASLAIAASVALNWRAREFLALAAALNLIYWVVGQGFGGIVAGGATDPNAGLLFIVFAYVMYTLIPYEQGLTAPVRRDRTIAGES